jgi:hypothetical protein
VSTNGLFRRLLAITATGVGRERIGQPEKKVGLALRAA